MPKIRRCGSFGIGYDQENEMCLGCGSAEDCLYEQSKAEAQIRLGIEPKSPVVELIPNKHLPAIPQKTPLEATRPVIEDGKIIIKLSFDLEWMRKVLGNFGKDDGKSKSQS